MSKKQPVMSHDPLAGLAEPESDTATEPSQDVRNQRNQAGEDGAVVVLESTLTIAESAELHDTLLGHMRAETPLVINASDVEVIDTAGLQLIAATFKTAGEQGVSVCIDQPSECFSGAARRIGLGALFGLDDTSQDA